MSKLLISCDDYIFSHGGKYYYKNREWYNFYHRYLRVFEEIRIVNRVVEEDKLKEERVLIEEPNVEVYPVPIFHGPSEYATKYFSVGRALKYAVKGCDAAILRLPSTIAQRVAKNVKRMGLPYACEVVFNAKDGHDSSSNIVERLLWFVIDRRMKKTCLSADGVSCVTEFQLQKRYFSKKPGHFESHYSSLELPAAFYTSERSFPEHKPMTIAHVSNQVKLYGRKGESVVLKAISLLKQQGIVVKIQFAGDDWDNSSRAIYDFAKAIGIREQVCCVGYLNRDQIEHFLENADLFVLPTRAEGLPRVVIEAMAKGLPVITTSVSGNPELVSEHFLVDYNDEMAISERIKELITNGHLYESVSRENFEKSKKYEASVLEQCRDEYYKKLKLRCQSK